MIKYLIFCFLFVSINGQLSLCKEGNITSKYVNEFCLSHNGELKSRCCYVFNSTNLLAIDLTEMNLDKVPDLIEYVNLTLIDLRLNSQLKSSKNNDFLGLKSLNYLLLPEQYSCPGDKHVWQFIDVIDNPKGNICKYQKDICTNSTDMCNQSRSYCLTNGPNHFLCLCKDGYYGYKCLRHGHFPAGLVFTSIIIITTILSTFFYLTHRKNMKKD